MDKKKTVASISVSSFILPQILDSGLCVLKILPFSLSYQFKTTFCYIRYKIAQSLFTIKTYIANVNTLAM